MNWKKELKVGDKFLFKELTHIATVTGLTSTNIIFDWRLVSDGQLAGSPSISLEHFYSLDFISPITPLLESLL